MARSGARAPGGPRKVEQAPVTVYTVRGCIHCQRARTLLASHSIEYEEVEGDRSPEFRAQLASAGRSGTAPQIVIDGNAIGGASELARLDRLGVLTPLARGERFPYAVAQRRLSPAGLLRSAFGLLARPGREPWQHVVALLDESGAIVETRAADSRRSAEALASELNDGPSAT